MNETHCQVCGARIYDAEYKALRAENERLRGDVKIIETSFTEVCDALGCAYDNEAALMAADALRAALKDEPQ